ncbi:cytochrome c-type biogenesis protein [Hyphomonas pacifica]|uniref:Cytochrome c-type biogenesis protein n=1 Tax=Hyphomonas pacifica TaxID=1280941 RepID=A0A062U0E1_9PROT|nr:cytochrome c-type biogenesis protein [Hyphomonas pacifica]KCZ51183.1 hypothetical protein HY2_12120 [Hyphomonas pacifica]RAN33662.1 hypothetical protein HY3_12220 [Hyphomonas pacifica]RAN35567.1 hypothetical protein HY11_13750 [Hyphomonas pacifica]
MRFLVILLASVLMMGAAHAEDVELDNPKQEARAQALMRELRCVACENEPISQSSAPIAEDMRARVRVMIEGGASDTEVRDWFEDRYGEFVLFRPKSDSLSGWVLWGTPFILLVFAALIGLAVARSRKAPIEPIKPEDI